MIDVVARLHMPIVMRSFRSHSAIVVVLHFAIAIQRAAAEDIEVDFSSASNGIRLAGLLVYGSDFDSSMTEVGRIDDNNRVVDEYAVDSNFKLTSSSRREYFVFPHDPARWTLMATTNKASPSAEALLKDRDFTEELATKFHAEWSLDQGKRRLVAKGNPRVATVCMRSQDAFGAPLANQAVMLIARERPGASPGKMAVWSGTTDGEGILEIRQMPGVHNWIVSFPGVGYTQTGSIVLDPGSQTEIQLPRLVPFAAIRGQVDERLAKDLKTPSRVFVQTFLAAEYRESLIDAQGAFQLTDLPVEGSYHLRVDGVRTEPLSVMSLMPGERRSDVIIEPPRKVAQEANVIGGFNNSWRREAKDPTLRGRVIDERGEPVHGAKVFAILKFHGGIRMMKVVREATTDDAGGYAIDNADLHSAPSPSSPTSQAGRRRLLPADTLAPSSTRP